jgi:membrane-associated protease RseP (regulator of RpoE activity)
MRKEVRIILIQIALFVATFFTTTIAGAEWAFGKSLFVFLPDGIIINQEFTWSDFASGLHFSIPFLFILTVHEFGHYFTAMIHKVDSSLPYYIPFPPIPFSIGTMGAVIRLRSKVYSKKQNFDIGIAGPIAGFIVAVLVLIYGFATLPAADYIFQIHPEYKQFGIDYAAHVYPPTNGIDVILGRNLLFVFLENVVADPARLPNVHEIIHYPYLFAGFLALIFTSLNLLPIGQLDGGHVLYGLVGFKVHRVVASVFFIGFMFYAGLGFEFLRMATFTDFHWYNLLPIPTYVLFLYFCFRGLDLSPLATLMWTLLVFGAQFLLMFLFPKLQGYSGWLVFGLLLGRFLGIQHPPSEIEEPLDDKRKILGWIAVAIFIICLTPKPIELIEPLTNQ